MTWRQSADLRRLPLPAHFRVYPCRPERPKRLPSFCTSLLRLRFHRNLTSLFALPRIRPGSPCSFTHVDWSSKPAESFRTVRLSPGNSICLPSPASRISCDKYKRASASASTAIREKLPCFNASLQSPSCRDKGRLEPALQNPTAASEDLPRVEDLPATPPNQRISGAPNFLLDRPSPWPGPLPTWPSLVVRPPRTLGGAHAGIALPLAR